MYNRIIDLEETIKRKSLFLLGPRQTGKSTFLKSTYPKALYVNLLKNSEYKLYSKNPEKIQDVVKYFVDNSNERKVIIDEVQRLPAILNEIHDLIEMDKSLRFILTGSSARKLKRGGANLLGGRASLYHLYPLCYPELESQGIKRWRERLLVGSFHQLLILKTLLTI